MEKDRRFIENLIKIGNRLAASGLIIGEGGNISVKDGDVIYIKRKNSCMGTACAKDYIKVNIKTGKPFNRNEKPSSEIYLHLACYKAKKNIKAVVHTHPIFATALGITGISLKTVSYEMAVLLKKEIARIPYLEPGTERLGQAVGKAASKYNAILLKNHGLVTIGENLNEAYLRTLAVERAAFVYLCSKMAGKIDFIRTRHLD